MTERQILDRIIGEGASLGDVVAAFTGTHTAIDGSRYSWAPTVTMVGEAIDIEADIIHVDSGTDIGNFARRLYYEKRAARAIHEVTEIKRAHFRKGLAERQYASAIRFYDRVGIRYVHLEAAGMGPFVWPAFGFDLDSRKQKQRLLALLRQADIVPLPPIDSLLAPEVTIIEGTDDPELGNKILEELGRLTTEDGQPLKMTLDLQRPEQRAILANRGIL